MVEQRKKICDTPRPADKARAVAQPGLARLLGVQEVVGSNPASPIEKNPRKHGVF